MDRKVGSKGGPTFQFTPRIARSRTPSDPDLAIHAKSVKEKTRIFTDFIQRSVCDHNFPDWKVPQDQKELWPKASFRRQLEESRYVRKMILNIPFVQAGLRTIPMM